MVAEAPYQRRRGDAAVVVRQAGDDAERAALRREATMLGLARHPGVVEIVRADPHGDELVTAAPTRTTLAELRGRPGRGAPAPWPPPARRWPTSTPWASSTGRSPAETILVDGRAATRARRVRPGRAGRRARPRRRAPAGRRSTSARWPSWCRRRPGAGRLAAPAPGPAPRSAAPAASSNGCSADAARAGLPPARRLARALERELGRRPNRARRPSRSPDRADGRREPARRGRARHDDPFARPAPGGGRAAPTPAQPRARWPPGSSAWPRSPGASSVSARGRRSRPGSRLTADRRRPSPTARHRRRGPAPPRPRRPPRGAGRRRPPLRRRGPRRSGHGRRLGLRWHHPGRAPAPGHR